MSDYSQLIRPAGPCAYCRREIRMYDGAYFSNVDDGELHTCMFGETHRGPRYVFGEYYEPNDWQYTPPDESAPEGTTP